MYLLRRKVTPLAYREVADPDRADRRPHQFEHLALHRLQHAPHLTVTTLGDRHFEESVLFAVAKVSHYRGTRHSIFQINAPAQAVHLIRTQSCGSLDLVS